MSKNKEDGSQEHLVILAEQIVTLIISYRRLYTVTSYHTVDRAKDTELYSSLKFQTPVTSQSNKIMTLV